MRDGTSEKTALVTGASRGIGAAIALALAQRGCSVFINYRSDEQNARSVLEKIVAAGGRAQLSRFDVRLRQETDDALDGILADGQGIDIVVNNAGVVRDGLFPTLTGADWEAVTRTTLDGFYNVTRRLVMPMARRRWGRIISISSVAGRLGNRGQVNYAAAKAGLIGATKALALEFAKKGVTVNAIAPGFIRTDMLDGIPIDELSNRVPMRRLGEPEEVASLVGFLASDESAYITGQCINIDGGLS